MPVDSIKDRIIIANREASAVMETIKSSPNLAKDEFYQLIRKYILIKFFLSDEVCTEDNIIELSELSIQRVLKISKGDLKAADISVHCAGTSSVIDKKVLLLLAIQKELGIKFNPDETSNAETIRQLSDLIYRIKIQ